MDDKDLEADCHPGVQNGSLGVDRIKSLDNFKHGVSDGKCDSGLGSLYSTGTDSLRSELNECRLPSNEDFQIPLVHANPGIENIEQRVESLTLSAAKDQLKLVSVDEGFVSTQDEHLRSEDLFGGNNTEENNSSADQLTSEQVKAIEEIYKQDVDGDTQLHTSIIQLLHNLSFYFISVLPNSTFLNIRNNYLQSPLHLAVITNQAHLVRKLMTAGAQVDIRDHRGNSPLHIAAKEGYAIIVKLLLEPIQYNETRDNTHEIPYEKIPQNLEGRNYDGQVALHVAAEGAHLDVIAVLISAGGNINVRDGKSGRTILHYAAESGHMKMLSCLLDLHNIDINATTYGGLTPIMLAVGRSNDEAVRLLKERGAMYESDESEEEDMNEEVYEFKSNGCPV